MKAFDLCLVLLLDASGSVDGSEWALQAQATADAISSPAIVERITNGPNGGIAIAAFEWSERSHVILTWTEIRSQADATHVAQQLTLYQRQLSGSTGVGDALQAALAAFLVAPECDRRVVDLSSDGSNNTGSDPVEAVTTLSAHGILVNGIIIPDEPNVEDWYRATLSGFVLTATWESYAQAIRQKLQLEIAGLYP
jgi:Ca-activated chloride channel family protein